MSDKNRGYHQQAVKRHYGGELGGLSHRQLYRPRGLRGTTLGPASFGHRLDAASRSRPTSLMPGATRPVSARDAARVGMPVSELASC